MTFTIRKWQLVSIVIVGLVMFVWSVFAVDKSAEGIYDGQSKSEVFSQFPPFADLFYSVTPYYSESDFDPNAPDTKGHIYGFITTPNSDGSLYVPFVLPNSPAEQAGLHAGDTIRSIDGTALSQNNNVMLDRQLDSEESTRLEIGAKEISSAISVRKADISIPPAYAYVSGKQVAQSYFKKPDGTMKALQDTVSLNALAQTIATTPTQYVVAVSPTSYFVLALFWAGFDAIVVVLLLGWLPGFFMRPHGRVRVYTGSILTFFIVPALFTVSILLLFNILDRESLRIFVDFGVHRSTGFGIDFGYALTALIEVPIMVLLFSIPNLVLIVRSILKGSASSLMQKVISFPR